MGRTHPSTPAERVQWVSHMLAHSGEYGLITQLARTLGVSRPTLYAWKAQARLALEQAFLDTTTASVVGATLERQILTLLIEGHNSYANIQTCLRALTGQRVSIGTIATIVQEAQRRALAWMASHAPASPRSLALDEIYANNRCGAYLNVVDTDSWAVWAAEGPLPVDAESWTLLLWLAQDRGLTWHTTVSDGGDALRSACQTVDPDGRHARDHWHVLRSFSQVQQRLARRVRDLQARTPTVERQAARIAAGKKARGGKPRTDLAAHQAEIADLARTCNELQALGQLLREVLAVVVLDRDGVQAAPRREQNLTAVLELLWELHSRAPSAVQAELKRLHTQLRLAQPALLTFVAPLAAVEQAIAAVVGSEGVALIGWAWLRRKVLGWDTEQLVAGVRPAWRSGARVLIEAWERATRASSAVENWHSIVRPHLAVHRVLSPGMLALLAVWHNHRVFSRGVHKGHSPLHLSGMLEAPTDWLLALGYAPAPAQAMPTSLPLDDLALAA
jgi:transposase-like protein